MVTEHLILILHIPASNLDPYSSYRDRDFRDIHQPHDSNSGTLTEKNNGIFFLCTSHFVIHEHNVNPQYKFRRYVRGITSLIT
jgi:hypothetical protein